MRRRTSTILKLFILSTLALVLPGSSTSSLETQVPSFLATELSGGGSLDEAEAALRRGEHSEAERLFRIALDGSDRWADDAGLLARNLAGLGLALLLQGEVGEAGARFEWAHTILVRRDQVDPGLLGAVLHGYGRALVLLGRDDPAEAMFRRELAVLEEQAAGEPLAVARTLRQLGRIHARRGQLDLSRELAKRERAIYEQELASGGFAPEPSLNPIASDSESGVAGAGLRLHYLRAVAILQEPLWKDPAGLAAAFRCAACLYTSHDLVDDAVRYRERSWLVQPPDRFASALSSFRRLPGPKALALALDDKGCWSYGFYTGAESLDSAVERALGECRQRLAEHGVDSECRVYALENEVVWQPRLAR